jgi:hypothetical protein
MMQKIKVVKASEIRCCICGAKEYHSQCSKTRGDVMFSETISVNDWLVESRKAIQERDKRQSKAFFA